jgi:hypothetical protein
VKEEAACLGGFPPEDQPRISAAPYCVSKSPAWSKDSSLEGQGFHFSGVNAKNPYRPSGVEMVGIKSHPESNPESCESLSNPTVPEVSGVRFGFQEAPLIGGSLFLARPSGGRPAGGTPQGAVFWFLFSYIGFSE